MAWQEEDVDGNRQGLTIAEYGELGGPGMGGCPAGPAERAPRRPAAPAVVRSADKRRVRSVDARHGRPGAAAVTGYSVVAIAETASATGEQEQVGKRPGAAATRTTIPGWTRRELHRRGPLAGRDRMSEAFAVLVPAAAHPGRPAT